MDKKVLIDLALKFVSRKLAAAGLTIYEICENPELDLWQRGLAAGVGIFYIIVQGWLDKKKLEKTGKVDDAVPPSGNGSSKVVPAILLAILIGASALAPIPANAEIIPYIDKLDLQIGPGIEIVDTDPFTIDEVLLGTAKLYERYKIELRIGGLLSDSRRALIFNATRSLSDLILRDDDGEEKALLPTIGIWLGGDIIREENEKGDEEIEIDFLWGFNAVMAEF